MPFIKKLVMQGFKSFPKKTELIFTPRINVVLGPNGSGKSNISEALCFVLGRLSIKSMRASKAGNLIFMGSKSAHPSKEAMVEIFFDNTDRVFSVDSDEISIKRIVRKTGNSIYKINNKTQTRQDVLLLLSQAGMDPNGFNIILQWEIQNFVRMPGYERRKIIEEVSGISVYESRKEKAMRELEKTEEKLKEVSTILRERTAYLANLERERQLALKYKKLEEDVRKFKASIIHSDLSGKRKELEKVNVEISKRSLEIEKVRKEIFVIRENVENINSGINSINSTMQKSTGFEQEKLNQEIANLMAELAGLEVKIENYESKTEEVSKQKNSFLNTIKENESSIKELQTGSLRKKQEEIDGKKKELEKVEEQRKKFYMTKSEIKSLRERIEDKKKLLANYKSESDFFLKQIEHLESEMFDKKTTPEKLNQLKISLLEKNGLMEKLAERESEIERVFYSTENEIKNHQNLAEKISKMDICPVCKSKITKEHSHSIASESKKEINSLKKEIENSKKEMKELQDRKNSINGEIKKINLEIADRDADLVRLSASNDKKDGIKSLGEKILIIKNEIFSFESMEIKLEKNFSASSDVEQKYETLRVEVSEISSRSQENVDSEILFKQRELERAKISLKQLLRTEEDISEDLSSCREAYDEKERLLEEKRFHEEELSRKFRKLISDREEMERKRRAEESKMIENQNTIRSLEQEINHFSIDKARLGAEVENYETEMLDFSNVEIIKSGRDSLMGRLEKTKENLARIGAVNLLSLSVYDSVKKQYDEVNGKVEIIKNEKEGILMVIHEIDVKKKKTFMNTLNSLNEIFSRNFSGLSAKGNAYLELENKKEPFEGGINIVIKTGHGKYLDVTSLSGGERVLVALSLIFAIQELNPYHFYILDEVDASLDKRNSERLAHLFKKYMQKGQYIIITHNDEIISNATNLYGVSMNEGISKVISLKV